jgi:UTP--glucose-1-phosphate uridylyltransferase
MIHKAVIPCAGFGTRMRPFSLAVPKELAPLGSQPALQLVLEEARAAGITDVALVLRQEKSILEEYLLRAREGGLLEDLGLHYLYQPEPKGLAEAMSLARDFAGDDPFLLLLPDNVFLSPEHTLSPMLALAEERQQEVVGLIEVDHRQNGLFGDSGRIEGREIGPGVFSIRKLQDKRPGRLSLRPGEGGLRACGRSVWRPHVFDFIDRLRSGVRGEFDEVPVLQAIVAAHGALGVRLAPPLFDIGHPEGLLAASAYLVSTTA